MCASIRAAQKPDASQHPHKPRQSFSPTSSYVDRKTPFSLNQCVPLQKQDASQHAHKARQRILPPPHPASGENLHTRTQHAPLRAPHEEKRNSASSPTSPLHQQTGPFSDMCTSHVECFDANLARCRGHLGMHVRAFRPKQQLRAVSLSCASPSHASRGDSCQRSRRTRGEGSTSHAPVTGRECRATAEPPPAGTLQTRPGGLHTHLHLDTSSFSMPAWSR